MKHTKSKAGVLSLTLTDSQTGQVILPDVEFGASYTSESWLCHVISCMNLGNATNHLEMYLKRRSWWSYSFLTSFKGILMLMAYRPHFQKGAKRSFVCYKNCKQQCLHHRDLVRIKWGIIYRHTSQILWVWFQAAGITWGSRWNESNEFFCIPVHMKVKSIRCAINSIMSKIKCIP